MNVRTLSSDLSPSLPRNNNTATIRITVPAQVYIEVEQEYLEGSVLNGFAFVGGVWTLINGTFAAIFGSTLLLVLFGALNSNISGLNSVLEWSPGIKPLSIYGIAHFFRSGRASLADRGYTFPQRSEIEL